MVFGVSARGHEASSGERFAVRLMVAQAFLFAAETAAIHHLGPRVPLMLIVLIRAAAGLALTLALALARSTCRDVFRTRRLPLQLVRGCIALGYGWVLTYSFSRLPFGDATAISYTQAAYIAVFSVFILGELVTPFRWAGAAIGIIGASLIAKPAFSEWNSAYLVALLGTSLNGLGFVLNKYMQREDSELTTMFYTNLVPFLANLPVLVFAPLPGPETLLWLPAILVLGPVGMYAGIIAVKYAGAAMLGPYTLLRLVIGLVGGVVVFHELPDIRCAVGASLILMGCLLASRPA